MRLKMCTYNFLGKRPKSTLFNLQCSTEAVCERDRERERGERERERVREREGERERDSGIGFKAHFIIYQVANIYKSKFLQYFNCHIFLQHITFHENSDPKT